jgi:hypothetical protein
VEGLNWFWITVLLTAAPVLAVLVALPCWNHDEWILGNIGGTVMIFGIAMGLIFRESAELNLLTRECLDAGVTCWPEPSAFTRFSIYAVIGLVEVVTLFVASLKVEQHRRNRRYAPEWR